MNYDVFDSLSCSRSYFFFSIYYIYIFRFLFRCDSFALQVQTVHMNAAMASTTTRDTVKWPHARNISFVFFLFSFFFVPFNRNAIFGWYALRVHVFAAEIRLDCDFLARTRLHDNQIDCISQRMGTYGMRRSSPHMSREVRKTTCHRQRMLK